MLLVGPVLAGIAHALAMPLSSGSLRLRAFAAPFRSAERTATILIGAHLEGADLTLDTGDAIEVAFQGMTFDGDVVPGGRFRRVALDLAPQSREAVRRTGVRTFERLQLPAGRYQVRLAVRQPGRHTGSIVTDVEVPDYSAPLVMSGVLVVSQDTAAHATLVGDPDVRGILGSDPTLLRRFSRRDVLTAFAEVYANPTQLREAARITAEVTSAAGARRLSSDVTVVADDQGRLRCVTRVSLDDLAPGDYVLTMLAQAGVSTASRQVAFSVTDDEPAMRP